MTIDPVVTTTVRLALGLLFAVAAWHKVRAPRAFAAALDAYRVVPARAVWPAAAGVTASEAGAAVLLLAPSGYRLGAAVAALLLAAYAGAIALNLARGRRDLDCGCGGPGPRRPVSGALVARNGVLCGGALLLTASVSARPLGWLDATTITAALVTLTALYVGVERLEANRPGLARVRGGT